ncbi:unnamed protein product [Schistosoma margrebowiei]|uniref:Uncharacterized protein n=1 Tax=Schistosoma margrebowiei TaxID=48269 RepID=A0A183LEE9_9TREM|nr:unnamed protein product [Schistosoma margrebowiei]
MKTSTSEGKYRIQWTAYMQLDNFNHPNDLPILSQQHEQMQVNTTGVAAASILAGLNIHKGKSNILKY